VEQRRQPVANGAAKLWGEELQHWRTKTGLTQGQLAAQVPCAQSWISTLESGKGVATPATAEAIDKVLNTGGALARSLKYVLREATSAYHPDWFQDYVALEARAVSAHGWSPFGVPSLLQTEAYMRAQFVAWGHHPTRVDELTEARLSRQELLFGDCPLLRFCVIDESALDRQLGGIDVMRNQLVHLVRLSMRPNITVQVFPTEATPLPTLLDSRIDLLTLPDGQVHCYSEALDRGWITSVASEVQATQARYDRLRASALPERESRNLIRSKIGEVPTMTPAINPSELTTFKSSYSGGDSGCVGTSRDLLAVGIAPVVDTALGDASPVLPFSTAAFASFVDAIKRRDPAFAFGERYVTL